MPGRVREILYEIVLPHALTNRTPPGVDRVIVLIPLCDWFYAYPVFIKRALPGAEVKFLPQGLGLLQFLKEVPADEREGLTIALDVGFHTVSVIPARGGIPIKNVAFAVRGLGVGTFLRLIEDDDPYALASRLEKGDPKLTGILKRHFWAWLFRGLVGLPYWKREWSEAGFLVGGGSAYFLQPSGIREKVSIVPEPEMANVKGLLLTIAGTGKTKLLTHQKPEKGEVRS